MSPPGGAKDETPPTLISTTPPNKTTNYDGDQISIIDNANQSSLISLNCFSFELLKLNFR